MGVQMQEIIDLCTVNDIAVNAISRGSLLVTKAIQDAAKANYQVAVNRPLTAQEAHDIAVLSAEASCQAALEKSGKTQSQVTDYMEKRSQLVTEIETYLNDFIDTASADNVEQQKKVIEAINACLSNQEAYMEALNVIAQKEKIANQRKEILFTNINYIMYLYQQLVMIANESSNIYKTYNHETQTYTPLIVNANDALTYPDIYNIQLAENTYVDILGDYKRNSKGQFLNQAGTPIDMTGPLKALTGDAVAAVEDGAEVYYTRNSYGAGRQYNADGTVKKDENGNEIWTYSKTNPFAAFDSLVLQQNNKGLLQDIMITQEQEDVYNLVKEYETFLNNKYHIRWYRKNPNYTGSTDRYAGFGWELLNDMTRTMGNPTGQHTEEQLVLHTEYTLVDPTQWRRIFPAHNRADFNRDYSKIRSGYDQNGSPIYGISVYGTAPQEVKDHPNKYFYFTQRNSYNWSQIKWMEDEYPNIALSAVIDADDREFYINTTGAVIVTCRNRAGAYVYVYGSTSFRANPDDPKTELLEDTYQNSATSWQKQKVEVDVYDKFVVDRPYELFSLDHVELWGKLTTTTFKAVITYNGTYITSNEIVFTNKSNAALADILNELNSRFKLQLIRPIHNAVHEEVPSGNPFGTKHIADDNVSEFYVFDERGHAVDNEEGIPYYQVPYYAILMMRDPEDENDEYEIMQYDNAAGTRVDEMRTLADKLEEWGRVTEWGIKPEPTISTAAGYLSASDKTKMCAYCNVLSFEEVYEGNTSHKLYEACKVMSDDDPTSAYNISWVTTDQNQVTRDFGNRSMFNYCKRLTVAQLNDRFDIGLSENQRIFALEFKIKSDFSLANNNPSEAISLNINYNGQNFRVERELHFGPASTMGSEYSVSIACWSPGLPMTNSHVLRLDTQHDDNPQAPTGICHYNLAAVVRHKGQELTADEKAKMQVYWYLNSGLNSSEYRNTSVDQMSLTEAGSLSIRYLPQNGEAKPYPVVPPIITVRIDGLAPYSLYYSQPFQVFNAANLVQGGPNPWRVSVPDRVLFKSDGAEPLFHKANFVIEKVEYASTLPGGINDEDFNLSQWTKVDWNANTQEWTFYITKQSYFTIPYKQQSYNFGDLGLTYLDPMYTYYSMIEMADNVAIPLMQNTTDVWNPSVDQQLTVKFAAKLNVGYLVVAQAQYTYIEGDPNNNIYTISKWESQGSYLPSECLDNIEGEYTPTWIIENGRKIAPWKLFSRYHIGDTLFTDNTSVFNGERIEDVGHEYFMTIGANPYDAKVEMSHWLCVTHNGAAVGDEPEDGSNAKDLPTGEVWGLDFYDSLESGGNYTAQWEEKLRDAHTYLQCPLPDGSWFTSSIVFERQVYCSSLVNSWSGSELILDEETNTVMTQHLVVGSKDSNNTFTGLMMGDWNGKYNDGSIDVPGLYGFRSGAQTFGLLTTGEAFFGAAGSGRIYINKRAGVISNYNMTAYINLNPRATDKIDEDTYDIRSKGYSPFFLYCEGDKGAKAITGPETDWHDLENRSKDRDIFAVDPHRGVFISGGIRSSWGNIGGWEISDAGLTKKKNNSKIYLGIGNDSSSAEENLYLFMLITHYLSNHKRGIVGCHDASLITYYQNANSTYASSVTEGITYLNLLKIADKIWWDRHWRNGEGFADEAVQYLFTAYQTQVYDQTVNAISHNDPNYANVTKTAFEYAIAHDWLLPLRMLNWIYKIEPIVTTDGYITTTIYPLIMPDEAGEYSVFNYETQIKELYSKSRQIVENDLSATPYIMWAGPASKTMTLTEPGIFSVTGDGYLYAETGTVGGWNLLKHKLYASNNLTTYVYDEHGQKVQGEYGEYITQQNADGNYLIELDTGNKVTEGYNSPFIALLNRNILLESASSGGNGRTYARMGFYYDPLLTYEGRMLRRVDSSEIYHSQVAAMIEVEEQMYDSNGLPVYNQDGTPRMRTVLQPDVDEHGQQKYIYEAHKYKPSGETTWDVEATWATPENCGWVVTADNDAAGHYLGELHYWEAGGSSTPVEYIRYIPLNVDGNGTKGVLRWATGGYNIVIDGYDAVNRGSIKLGECTLSNGTTYPAIEILGTGVIRLHHDNIILDGVNREVQIGTKDENGVVSIVGFSIRSTDVDTIAIDYRGGPTIYTPDTETEAYDTSDPDENNPGESDVTYWHDDDPETYSVGYGLSLTYAVPYQSHQYKLEIDGDYLEFTRYLANETGSNRFTDKGLVMVSGSVTRDNLGDGETMRNLEESGLIAYDKTILIPASNLNVNEQTHRAAIASTAKTGLLYRWDLVGDWVSTGTVYASKGVFGPDGELASVNYVNEKLADLASQIANLLGRINGNIANLRRIIKAMAGGDDGIKQILGENGQHITYTYTDENDQQQSVTLNATNLLEQVAKSLGDIKSLQDTVNGLDKKYSQIGHTHDISLSIPSGMGGAGSHGGHNTDGTGTVGDHTHTLTTTATTYTTLGDTGPA